MIQRRVRIGNELGIHARAAARLVRLTSTYRSQVWLARAGADERINGKSILGVLLLAAAKGMELDVFAEGPDEQEALEAVSQLIKGRFGEER